MKTPEGYYETEASVENMHTRLMFIIIMKCIAKLRLHVKAFVKQNKP